MNTSQRLAASRRAAENKALLMRRRVENLPGYQRQRPPEAKYRSEATPGELIFRLATARAQRSHAPTDIRRLVSRIRTCIRIKPRYLSTRRFLPLDPRSPMNARVLPLILDNANPRPLATDGPGETLIGRIRTMPQAYVSILFPRRKQNRNKARHRTH